MNYLLVWQDGSKEVIEGATIQDAFNRSAYGNGAMKALDYYRKFQPYVPGTMLHGGDMILVDREFIPGAGVLATFIRYQGVLDQTEICDIKFVREKNVATPIVIEQIKEYVRENSIESLHLPPIESLHDDNELERGEEVGFWEAEMEVEVKALTKLKRFSEHFETEEDLIRHNRHQIEFFNVFGFQHSKDF